MIQDFYWVIKNTLAGMAMPSAGRAFAYLGDADQAAQEEFDRELRDLKDCGIQAIVTLTEYPLDATVIKKANMNYLHIPIPDMTAPTQSQIEDFVQFTSLSIKNNKPVVVHCLGGSGRTGTMIACYLVKQGASSKEAVNQVRRARPSAIETYTQEEAIIEYSVHVSQTS